MASDISVVVIEVADSKGRILSQHKFEGPKPQNESQLRQFQNAVSQVRREWYRKYDWKRCKHLGVAIPPNAYNPELGLTTQVVYQ